INDKCSAGTGAFFEFILSYLDLNFNDLQANQKNAKIFHLNNTCTVFALSEIISYMTEGATPGDVIASINEAFAKKIAGILPECRTVVLIGGVARNQGFVESLRRCLKAALLIPPEPQMVNALGAALYIENKEGT
ncbi:MAG: BadF/BadG/BcrA/BcrD ATPase family protein, partial [Thermoplasmata archaeon]